MLSLRTTVVENTGLSATNRDNNALGKWDQKILRKVRLRQSILLFPQLFKRGDNANFAVGVITCACATVAGAIRLCTCSIRARNTCILLLLLLFPSKNIPTLDEYQYFFLPFLSFPSPSCVLEEALMVLLWDPNCTPSDRRGDPFGLCL